MTFADIDTFFHNPPPIFLTLEMAVGYVLSVLLQADSYATELIQRVEEKYPGYKLSDSILYKALQFLEEEQTVSWYWQKKGARGRPRRMFRLQPASVAIAKEIAQLWHNYMTQRLCS